VDSASARPYYVVVDSGGWFKSKHFLVPTVMCGWTTTAMPRCRSSEGADQQVSGLRQGEFEKFSEGDIKRMNDSICVATNVTAVTYAADEPYSAAWTAQYRQPDWWNTTPSLPTRMGDRASRGVEYPPSKIAPTSSMSTRVRHRPCDRATRPEHQGEPCCSARS